MHHGGFIVGLGSKRAYVDGKVSYFDHCEADSWSLLWLDNFLGQLNYLKSTSCKVFWLLPGKDLADGLRILSSDADTLVMMSIVHKFKEFVLYVDHDDHISWWAFGLTEKNRNGTKPNREFWFPQNWNRSVPVEFGNRLCSVSISSVRFRY